MILPLYLGLTLLGGLYKESELQTLSGVMTRYSSADGQEFKVELIRPDGALVILEFPPSKLFESPIQWMRAKRSEAYDEVIQKIGDESVSLGFSRRIFDSKEDSYACNAVAHLRIPTPLSDIASIHLDELKCSETEVPMTESKSFQVLGPENRSWVKCAAENSSCEWNIDFKIAPEAASQASAFSFLDLAKKSLQFWLLIPKMEFLSAKSWATPANKSRYDSRRRTFYFGAGNYLDAADGFVVTHEWGHALIDDINHQLWGYDAEVLHEAIADFTASQIFESPCIAPYDAQEVADRKCLRDLEPLKIFPYDYGRELPHSDSLVLSGALWEISKILKSALTIEVVLEALIRSPKQIDLRMYWAKFEDVYKRILLERPKLEDQRSEIEKIGSKHGLRRH